MFNISNLNLKDLYQFVEDPHHMITTYAENFEKIINEEGSNSFISTMTMFKDPKNIEIVIQSRPFEDKNDMYKAINEMLYFYSSANCSSLIFAADVRQSKYNTNKLNSELSNPIDALSLSFASSDSSGLVTLPYQVINNKLTWVVNDFSLNNLAEENPSKSYQGDIPELFYIMSNLEGPIFTSSQLLNYYSYKNFKFSLSKDSSVQTIKLNL